jgi:hypothetical protein
MAKKLFLLKQNFEAISAGKVRGILRKKIFVWIVRRECGYYSSYDVLKQVDFMQDLGLQ